MYTKRNLLPSLSGKKQNRFPLFAINKPGGGKRTASFIFSPQQGDDSNNIIQTMSLIQQGDKRKLGNEIPQYRYFKIIANSTCNFIIILV